MNKPSALQQLLAKRKLQESVSSQSKIEVSTGTVTLRASLELEPSLVLAESPEVVEVPSKSEAWDKIFPEFVAPEPEVLAKIPETYVPSSILLETPEPEPKESPEVSLIRMRIAELRQALDANIPGFVTILADIHGKLKADPAIVTILSEDEIKNIIIRGMERHAEVTVSSPSSVKTAKKMAKNGTLTADML